jgi:hypothetical protein
MTSLSTSRVLTELEQVQVLNEVLDIENFGQFNLADDSFFDNDHTQLGTQET